MKILDRLSIRGKLLLVILGVSLPAILLLGVSIFYFEAQRSREALRQELSALATLLGNRSIGSIAFRDERSGRDTLSLLSTLPHVQSGCLYHEGGRMFAAYQAEGAARGCPPEVVVGTAEDHFDGGGVTVQRPIRVQDQVAGAIVVRSTTQPVGARVRAQFLDRGIVTIVAIVLSVVLAVYLQRLITQPVDRMLVTIQRQNRDLEELNAQLDERVRERTAELEATNRELQSFTYTVSHDLRAPLRAILGFAAVLKSDHIDPNDAECRRLLQRITSNAERMANLIDDLLSFSRLGRSEPVPRDVNMQALVESTIADLKVAGDIGTEFVVGDLPPARGDAAMLRQVWENLLGNAWKFSRKTPSPRIEVGGRRLETGNVEYFVRDNGAGFDMRYAGKLFGTFQRLHTDEEFQGTGVGLAIVNRIVLLHGGTVLAEGEVGKGATLRFTLPA
jgi:signal transduction histidine kinase